MSIISIEGHIITCHSPLVSSLRVRMDFMRFRPAVAKVPVIVNDKFKVRGQVEFVLYQLVQLLCIHLEASHTFVQSAADADVEAVGGLI